MEISVGMIVKSVSGHDSGSWYVVTDCGNDAVYIADGRRRKVSKPKLKNPKHLVRSKKFVSADDMQILTDKKLRSLLHQYNFGANDKNPEESD